MSASESAVPDACWWRWCPLQLQAGRTPPLAAASQSSEELSIETGVAEPEWNDYLKHQEFRDDRYHGSAGSEWRQPAIGLPEIASGDAGSLSGAADRWRICTGPNCGLWVRISMGNYLW